MRNLLVFIATALFLCPGFTQNQDTLYFAFAFHNEGDSLNVIAGTTDTLVINEVREQLNLPLAERSRHINGVIDYGTSYNNPRYDWHFVVNEWTLADVSIELCDGDPRFVDDNLEYWVDTVGRYCPFSAYVLREVAVTPVKNPPLNGKNIKLYPNPTTGILQIEFNDPYADLLQLCLFDSLGRLLVCKEHVWAGGTFLDFEDLADGIYWLKVSSDRGVATKKIMLRRS